MLRSMRPASSLPPLTTGEIFS
ncbi:unnamed protein product [Timema podura]|uniref:Uncharacterized protein n=1 Tax=Timema podura TaxID=61482 RepID=A0ABN7PHB5_TIMPD|nr:unnamed protein product [Timema podura]